MWGGSNHPNRGFRRPPVHALPAQRLLDECCMAPSVERQAKKLRLEPIAPLMFLLPRIVLVDAVGLLPRLVGHDARSPPRTVHRPKPGTLRRPIANGVPTTTPRSRGLAVRRFGGCSWGFEGPATPSSGLALRLEHVRHLLVSKRRQRTRSWSLARHERTATTAGRMGARARGASWGPALLPCPAEGFERFCSGARGVAHDTPSPSYGFIALRAATLSIVSGIACSTK